MPQHTSSPVPWPSLQQDPPGRRVQLLILERSEIKEIFWRKGATHSQPCQTWVQLHPPPFPCSCFQPFIWALAHVFWSFLPFELLLLPPYLCGPGVISYFIVLLQGISCCKPEQREGWKPAQLGEEPTLAFTPCNCRSLQILKLASFSASHTHTSLQ